MPAGIIGGIASGAGVALRLVAGATVAGEVPNFNLLDLAGHNYELQRAGGRALVLFFTARVVRSRARAPPKLRDVTDRFTANGVSFWIVNRNADDKPEEMRHEYPELGLWGLTCLRDPKQCVALGLGVPRTDQVVAIGTGDWQVFHQGAMDDQFGEGAERAAAQNRFLDRRLEEFFAGQPITTVSTKAHECLFAFAGADVPSCSKEVAPLLRQHCAACHRNGGFGP